MNMKEPFPSISALAGSQIQAIKKARIFADEKYNENMRKMELQAE